MAKATITIEDTPDGAQQVTASFGEGVDNASGAHRLCGFLMQAVKEAHAGDAPAEFTAVPAEKAGE